MNKPLPDHCGAVRFVAPWVVLALLFAAGCGNRDEPEPKPSTDAQRAEVPAAADTTPALQDAAPPASAAAPIPVARPASAIPPAQSPAPEPVAATPVEPMPAPEVATSSKVVDPGGMVEVAATRAGLTRVGAARCKTCHAIQFASWSASAHAARTPQLDCESCHGAGSAYKTLSVMKDPQQARAAGLVLPDRTFCGTCHRSGWSEDMLARAHAHKAGAAGK